MQQRKAFLTPDRLKTWHVDEQQLPLRQARKPNDRAARFREQCQYSSFTARPQVPASSLRAYARPYPSATAGTPEALRFDGDSGKMTYRYTTTLPSGRRARPGMVTEIRIPAIHYSNGYSVKVEGGVLLSTGNASVLRIRNAPAAAKVSVTLTRIGTLPPLPATSGEPDRSQAGLAALPPIPDAPLSRNSLLGHIIVTPGGRDLIEVEVPGMLAGMAHVHGWEKMTLAGIRAFAASVLTDAKLARIDTALARLKVAPGQVKVEAGARLSVDSLTSDLLADPRARHPRSRPLACGVRRSRAYFRKRGCATSCRQCRSC